MRQVRACLLRTCAARTDNHEPFNSGDRLSNSALKVERYGRRPRQLLVQADDDEPCATDAATALNRLSRSVCSHGCAWSAGPKRGPDKAVQLYEEQLRADLADLISVNGNRNLISCRQLKIDHLRVHLSSVAAVGTRPRSRSLSR